MASPGWLCSGNAAKHHNIAAKRRPKSGASHGYRRYRAARQGDWWLEGETKMYLLPTEYSTHDNDNSTALLALLHMPNSTGQAVHGHSTVIQGAV